jgi:hypothetical protein
MGQVCLVCSHPKRAEIDRLLAEPGSIKSKIGKQFGLKVNTICNHANEHLISTIVKAATAAEVVRGGSLFEAVLEHRNTVAKFVDAAVAILASCQEGEERKALSTIMGARGVLSEARAPPPLLGTVAGELNKVDGRLVGAPDWVRARAVILRALRPYPEAESAVLAALRSARV